MQHAHELVPGLYHWTAIHPDIEQEVHSYYYDAGRFGVVIDPMVPPDGLGWFDRHAKPKHVFLTNRLHYRNATAFAEHFDAQIWCHEAGVREFKAGGNVRGFGHGDELPGGITALAVGALTPEETALHVPVVDGALSLGDSVVRDEDDKLSFVPDELMGDDPAAVRNGLKRALHKLLEQPFDHLLLAHGKPWIHGAKSGLRHFLE